MVTPFIGRPHTRHPDLVALVGYLAEFLAEAKKHMTSAIQSQSFSLEIGPSHQLRDHASQ
jgi:hypothetical protein